MEKRAQDGGQGGQMSESRPPNTTVPWERSSLDPRVDPKVIPRNTHNEIEGNPLGIQESFLQKFPFTNNCWVKAWKALTLEDLLQRLPWTAVQGGKSLGVGRWGSSRVHLSPTHCGSSVSTSLRRPPEHEGAEAHQHFPES